MKYAKNVDVSESPSYEMSSYIHKVAEFLGISTLPGFVDIEFVKSLGTFAGLADGDEDQVDISIAETHGTKLNDRQIKINIAHEMVHAVQILTGRLVHTGLTRKGNDWSYRWSFDGKEYVNTTYNEQPWEDEAYNYEEKIYEAIESGRKICTEIQSSLYPRRQKERV